MVLILLLLCIKTSFFVTFVEKSFIFVLIHRIQLANLNAAGALEIGISFIDFGKTAFQMRIRFYHVTDKNDASSLVHATLIELSLVLPEKFAKWAEAQQIYAFAVAHCQSGLERR